MTAIVLGTRLGHGFGVVSCGMAEAARSVGGGGDSDESPGWENKVFCDDDMDRLRNHCLDDGLALR